MSGQWSRTLGWAMAVVAAIGIACGESKEEVKLAAVSVSPASASLAKGTSQSLVATAIYTNNTKKDVTAEAAWSVSDEAVLAVQSPGVVKGKATGPATISATYEGKTGSASLTVTAAEVVSLSVTPFEVALPKGVPAQLTAMARMTDDTVQDVTRDSVWSSSSDAVAVCEPCGRVETVAEGKATITASFGGRAASTSLTVTAAQVVELSLEPVDASVPKGMTQQMKAVGHFTDETTQDLTQFVKWCSLDESVATVSNVEGSRGLVSTLEEGRTQICASYCNTFTAMTALTVSPAVVVSLGITPSEESVPNGLTVQFRASAVFSDGGHRDLTGDVVWESSDDEIASISNADADAGLATGRAVGDVTITARASNSDVEAEATLHVTSAVVMQVQVTSAEPRLPKGLRQAFLATAIMSAGPAQDVTGQVTWGSSDEDVAPVSNAEEDAGYAFGKAEGGPVTITATHAGSGQSGSAQLTVTDAVIVRLEIAPAANASIPMGLDEQFTATAIYTDNSTQNVTALAAWSSSDEEVASVSMDGLAHGNNVGNVVIKAVHKGFSAEAPLEVTAAELTGISVSPIGSAAIPKGLIRAFEATGHYTDGIDHDITKLVTWTSSDPGVASISNAESEEGEAYGKGVGTATICAAMEGEQGCAELEVTREELVRIVVTPPAPVVPLGLRQQFAATGVYTDESEQDLTATVEWSSDDTDVATVHNALGSEGDTETLAVGSATITATYPGTLIQGSATIEVTAAVVRKLEIKPFNHSMAKGLYYRYYEAWGTFTNSDYRNLSADVAWTSSNRDVAPISNEDGTKGEAFGAAIGEVTISAALPYSPITATTKLTITEAVLLEVQVDPTYAERAAGYSAQFTATAIYTDGQVDVTQQANWSSSDYEIASVANGLAKGLKASTTPVTITASFGGLSAGAQFRVNPAVLVRVDVQPESDSIPRGLDATYEAIGTFSDDSTLDITGSVSWKSEPDGAPIVGKGVVHGSAYGEYTITATDVETALSDTAALTVTEEELVWVELTHAADLSMPKGLKAQFGAIGHFTDTTTRPYTALVTWSSEPEEVASFNCDGCVAGEAKGLEVGSAMISAMDPVSGFPAHVGSESGPTEVELVVTAAELVEIDVTPPYARLPAGLHQQFTATGTFTDGDVRDLTAAVIWTSSNEDVARVSNCFGAHGEAWAKAMGSTTITATFPVLGIHGEATFDVSAALLDYLYFDAAPAELPEGMSFTIGVWGMYTDGPHDMDGQADLSLSSSDPVLSITGDVATAGDCPADECLVTITASFPGWDGDPVSATMDVKIVPAVVTAIWFQPETPQPTEESELRLQIWGRKTLNPAEAVAIAPDDPNLGFTAGPGVTLRTDGVYLVVTRVAYGSSTVTATYTGPTLDDQPLSATVLVGFLEVYRFRAFATGSPTLDGQIAQDEWASAQCITADYGPSRYSLCLMNDAENLYVLVEVTNHGYDANAFFDLLFDNDADGISEPGEDWIRVEILGELRDAVKVDVNVGRDDTAEGGTLDVAGAVSHSNPVTGGLGTLVIEFRHPLASGDVNDISASPGDVLGFSSSYTSVPEGGTVLEWHFWPQSLDAKAFLEVAGP